MSSIDMTTLYEVIDELKTMFPNFEERDEQIQMWEAVYESMMGDKKAAIHAPTGTGKSLGYVIPFIATKLQNQKFQMTISTFTINLQEQLKEDIELGVKIYNNLLKKKDIKGKRIQYVALKGQKNYFCKKRFVEESPSELSEDKIKFVEKKMSETLTWDRQHFNLKLPHKEWETMQVDHCTKRQCPFHSHCTYFQDYMNIDDKDIVIANHSLWFTRFYYVEPWENFNFFVFDEAHKLEKVLLETYTFDLSIKKFENWIDQGEKIASKIGATDMEIETWRQEVTFDHPTILRAKDYFSKLELALNNQNATLEELGLPIKEAQEIVMEITRWQKDMFRSFEHYFVNDDLKEDDAYKEELKGWVKNLLDIKEFLSISNHKNNVGLLWVEKDFQDKAILKVTPKDIHMISSPFKKGCLVTSGTLAQNRSCKGFASRMKLDADIDLALTSPFPLQEQTMVYVSKDISPKKEDYKQKLESEIMELLDAGTQKSFVLFTSNRLMWDMFKKLNKKIRSMQTYNEQPLELWIQDKNNHKEVVQSFKDKEVRSILFGTLSYFEGIDLKGDSLTQIILTRLPFSVPTHPIQQILDAKHGYSHWEAIVRYEQAFGRLIRTGYDYGSFNILDNRVSYMRQFIELFQSENIPIVTQIDEIRNFYESQM